MGRRRCWVTHMMLLALAGCALPDSIETEGIVAWNYESISQRSHHAEPRIRVSIRVKELESDPASLTTLGLTPASIPKLLPLLSLFPGPPFLSMRNSVHGGFFRSTIGLQEDEIKELIYRELKESRLVDMVTLEDEPVDYELRGNVNFTFSSDAHYSGLGFLGALVFLPVILVVPIGTLIFECEAHFELLTADSGQVAHSKDYLAEKRVLVWSYNSWRVAWRTFGRDVFPQITAELIRDLRALPHSAWSRE